MTATRLTSISTALLSTLLMTLGACAQDHGGMQGDHSGPAMNFKRIDATLASGGHFVDGGLAAIRDAGVEVVIDLRPSPPDGQRGRVEGEDITWINIPMDWEAPALRDFELFSKAVADNQDKHLLIQCQANYRASAMTYLHRVVHLGVPEADARADLEAIWTPNDTWQGFIDAVLAKSAHAAR